MPGERRPEGGGGDDGAEVEERAETRVERDGVRRVLRVRVQSPSGLIRGVFMMTDALEVGQREGHAPRQQRELARETDARVARGVRIGASRTFRFCFHARSVRVASRDGR